MNRSTPILVLIFNRPEQTRQLLQLLKHWEPERLYIGADGPRLDKTDEEKKCLLARAVFDEITWDCEVKRLFRPENIGLKKAVSGAIDWFFEHEERGIILEDDCLANKGFYRFASELLEKYSDDDEVFHISAHNPMVSTPTDNSYFFSRQAQWWGWATWRRAWKHRDLEMETLEAVSADKEKMKTFVDYDAARDYIMEKWRGCRKGEINSWAYTWGYTCFALGKKVIIPTRNLMRNTGFNDEATNTVNPTRFHLESTKTFDLQFPLKHPANKEIINKQYELEIFYRSHKSRLLLFLRKWTKYHVIRKRMNF